MSTPQKRKQPEANQTLSARQAYMHVLADQHAQDVTGDGNCLLRAIGAGIIHAVLNGKPCQLPASFYHAINSATTEAETFIHEQRLRQRGYAFTDKMRQQVQAEWKSLNHLKSVAQFPNWIKENSTAYSDTPSANVFGGRVKNTNSEANIVLALKHMMERQITALMKSVKKGEDNNPEFRTFTHGALAAFSAGQLMASGQYDSPTPPAPDPTTFLKFLDNTFRNNGLPSQNLHAYLQGSNHPVDVDETSLETSDTLAQMSEELESGFQKLYIALSTNGIEHEQAITWVNALTQKTQPDVLMQAQQDIFVTAESLESAGKLSTENKEAILSAVQNIIEIKTSSATSGFEISETPFFSNTAKTVALFFKQAKKTSHHQLKEALHQADGEQFKAPRRLKQFFSFKNLDQNMPGLGESEQDNINKIILDTELEKLKKQNPNHDIDYVLKSEKEAHTLLFRAALNAMKLYVADLHTYLGAESLLLVSLVLGKDIVLKVRSDYPNAEYTPGSNRKPYASNTRYYHKGVAHESNPSKKATEITIVLHAFGQGSSQHFVAILPPYKDSC